MYMYRRLSPHHIHEKYPPPPSKLTNTLFLIRVRGVEPVNGRRAGYEDGYAPSRMVYSSPARFLAPRNRPPQPGKHSAGPLQQEKEISTMRRYCILVFLLSYTTVGICLAATAPKIFSTVVNYSNGQLHINGQNFSPSGLAPTVYFATTQLVLVSFSNKAIIATMPTG